MAEEDKTHCGQGDPARFDDQASVIASLTKLLGVSRQDVLDAMEQVGTDRAALEEFFRSKENSY